MLGDVGQPGAIRPASAERAADEVVVDRRPGLAGKAAALAEGRPDLLLGAQPRDPVLPGGDAAGRELIGDEPVPERRIVAVESSAALIRCASSQSRWLTGSRLQA
jgi:hypothetical protein